MQPRLNDAMLSDLCSEGCAHVGGIRNHPCTTQIQPIGIPAGADGWIIVMMAVGVPNTGVMQEVELVIRQFEPGTADTGSKRGSSAAMVRIETIIQALAVVEEGKQSHHRKDRPRTGRQDARVPFDPAPMIRSMNGVAIPMVRHRYDRCPQGVIVNRQHHMRIGWWETDPAESAISWVDFLAVLWAYRCIKASISSASMGMSAMRSVLSVSPMRMSFSRRMPRPSSRM